MQEFLNDTLNNLYGIFFSLPLLIKIIWMVIILELFLIIYSLTYLFIIRKKYQKNYKEYKSLVTKYQEILINYIYLTDEEVEERMQIEKKLKKAINNNFDRAVIQKLILRLHADLSGELATFLEKLYSDLDLVKYSLKKMNSAIWHIKIKGIREVTQMKVKGVYDKTLKLINNKNVLLRREAQLTMVKLYQFEGLKFLDTLEFPITEWQQIQLIEEIQTIRNQELPDLTKWLVSKNDSVVIFTLKIVKLYQQIQTQDTLIKLVLHPSEPVRRAAINVLGYFKITESKTILKQIFKNSPLETQIHIIKALSEIADTVDIPFFETQVKHPEFEISHTATETLKELKPYLVTLSITK